MKSPLYVNQIKVYSSPQVVRTKSKNLPLTNSPHSINLPHLCQWLWVGYESGISIPDPKILPMDIRLLIPVNIHTRILPEYIIHGYPYPTRNPFNLIFFNSKHFNVKTNQS